MLRNLSRLVAPSRTLGFSRSFCIPAARLSSADLEERRRRMLYHSKQRGWLELDLILGTFAEKYLSTLGPRDIDDYALILEEENPDMFKWLSGQMAIPENLKSLPVMDLLLKHIHENHPSTFQNQ
jgi:succinate dehydrogenase flavin-adding protein (antitoxin of CptAB toxin-antitoxin module)